MVPTRAQVRAAAAHRFPGEDTATVVGILDLYGVESYERERERVQVGILKLSGGDVDRLLAAVADAKKDYRDVLWWAEYPEPDGPRQGPPEDTGALLDWVTEPLGHGAAWDTGRPWWNGTPAAPE